MWQHREPTETGCQTENVHFLEPLILKGAHVGVVLKTGLYLYLGPGLSRREERVALRRRLSQRELQQPVHLVRLPHRDVVSPRRLFNAGPTSSHMQRRTDVREHCMCFTPIDLCYLGKNSPSQEPQLYFFESACIHHVSKIYLSPVVPISPSLDSTETMKTSNCSASSGTSSSFAAISRTFRH